MENAELTFQADLRGALARELQHEGRHRELDFFHFLTRQTVFALQLHARIDGRVNDDAAGKRLIGIQCHLEAFAEALGDLRIVLLGRHHIGEAALGLDHLIGAGEVLLRQKRRREAVLRRAPGMEALAMRTEHLAEAG